MTNELTFGDLNEMLGFAYLYHDAGSAKIQLNTEHAVEILTRLIAHEKDTVVWE